MLKKLVAVLREQRGLTILEWAALGVLILLAVWGGHPGPRGKHRQRLFGYSGTLGTLTLP
ncbi:MAG: hypothetical protein QMC81_10630 [Thermoanaerobacterales bacterium]|nr:hypothetical protein [Thermoanaerobacterales bacterium]